MRASRYAAALLLAASLWPSGPADASGAATVHGERAASTKPPASSVCMARCGEMETKCEAYEKEMPSCGTVDICFEEKEQCERLCRVTARLDKTASSPRAPAAAGR